MIPASQGEHSPRAEAANHMHERNTPSNINHPAAQQQQRSSMPPNGTTNNALKSEPDGSNHGDSANGNHKMGISHGPTANGVHSIKVSFIPFVSRLVVKGLFKQTML